MGGRDGRERKGGRRSKELVKSPVLSLYACVHHIIMPSFKISFPSSPSLLFDLSPTNT